MLRDGRDFGLQDQMIRAAISIASNIAEGAERNSRPDYIRFLHIAKGWAAEPRTQVYIGELASEQQRYLTTNLKRISAMPHDLSKAVQNKPGLKYRPKTEHRSPNTASLPPNT